MVSRHPTSLAGCRVPDIEYYLLHVGFLTLFSFCLHVGFPTFNVTYCTSCSRRVDTALGLFQWCISAGDPATCTCSSRWLLYRFPTHTRSLVRFGQKLVETCAHCYQCKSAHSQLILQNKLHKKDTVHRRYGAIY